MTGQQGGRHWLRRSVLVLLLVAVAPWAAWTAPSGVGLVSSAGGAGDGALGDRLVVLALSRVDQPRLQPMPGHQNAAVRAAASGLSFVPVGAGLDVASPAVSLWIALSRLGPALALVSRLPATHAVTPVGGRSPPVAVL